VCVVNGRSYDFPGGVQLTVPHYEVRLDLEPSDRVVLSALSRSLPRPRWATFLVTRPTCCAGTAP
jgi:hypothetical protein